MFVTGALVLVVVKGAWDGAIDAEVMRLVLASLGAP